MKTAIVIPARLDSGRFPGKALVRIAGKSLVRYAIDAAKAAKRADAVLLATDSEEIAEEGYAAGVEVCMTSGECRNGTERTAAAIAAVGWEAEAVVVLQADEPDLTGEHIDRLIRHADKRPFATLAFAGPVDPDDDSQVKAVQSGEEWDFTRQSSEGLVHLGAYIYSRELLELYAKTAAGEREQSERLEQLRLIEAGQAKCHVATVKGAFRSVNYPGDLMNFGTKEVVTEKPWGVSADIGNGLHRITVNAHSKCSIHKHQRKWNQFIAHEGRFAVQIFDADGNPDGPARVVSRGGVGSLTIPPGVVHQFHAFPSDGFTAWESYWTEDGSEPEQDDIIRMEEANA